MGKTYLDKKTGYYRFKNTDKFVHRWVWQKENPSTKIKKGYEIHHKDGDKLNNHISNLEMLSRSDHIHKHRIMKKKKDKQKVIMSISFTILSLIIIWFSIILNPNIYYIIGFIILFGSLIYFLKSYFKF